jgi:hypothetical protein
MLSSRTFKYARTFCPHVHAHTFTWTPNVRFLYAHTNIPDAGTARFHYASPCQDVVKLVVPGSSYGLPHLNSGSFRSAFSSPDHSGFFNLALSYRWTCVRFRYYLVTEPRLQLTSIVGDFVHPALSTGIWNQGKCAPVTLSIPGHTAASHADILDGMVIDQ